MVVQRAKTITALVLALASWRRLQEQSLSIVVGFTQKAFLQVDTYHPIILNEFRMTRFLFL